jgi:ribosome-associated protein
MSEYAAAVVDAALAAAEEKQGRDPVVLDLRGLSDAFDALVVTSGRNDRHVRTLAEEVERQVRLALGVGPIHVEGLAEGQWVALDFGDVIVHVFDEESREYYDLEHLWAAPARRPEGVRSHRA